MLRVATVRAWHGSHAAWIIEQGHETVVISTSEKSSIVGSSHTVDMSAICALRVDSLDVPSELHGRGCPYDLGSVGPTRWVLLAGIGLSEKQFVSSAVGSDPRAIPGPVKGHDVRRVLAMLAFERPVTGVVDVEIVVMRSDSEHRLVRTESHNFNPLF